MQFTFVNDIPDIPTYYIGSTITNISLNSFWNAYYRLNPNNKQNEKENKSNTNNQ